MTKTLLSASSLTKLDLVRSPAQQRRDAIKDRLARQKAEAIAAQNKKTVVVQAMWRDRIWYASRMYGGSIDLHTATRDAIQQVANEAMDQHLSYHDLQFFIRYMK